MSIRTYIPPMPDPQQPTDMVTGNPEEAAPVSEEQDYDPGEHTIDEVKEYVEAHPDVATQVLESEQTGKDRVTLVSWLEEQTPEEPTA